MRSSLSPSLLLALLLLLPVVADLAVAYIGERPLSLLTYNVFFLPSAARAVVDPWGWWHRDPIRRDWLATNLGRHSYDFLCLMETFNPGARRAIAEALRRHHYQVVEHFNSDGWLLANAGLSFATRHAILDHDFETYRDVTLMTSEMLASKGVGFALVNVSSPMNGSALVCVFLTHVQAEKEGRSVRRKQFAQIHAFVRRKLAALQPRRCVTLLAGDMNVDGLQSVDATEYEEMLLALRNPTDLYRMLHPIEVDAEAATNEGARLDYVLAYPPRIGMPTAALEVVNCTVQRGWSAGNVSVSDHDPVLAFFRIPVFDGKPY
eukprot:GGOE01006511.1.p1 GENE.GGOE01006511.1~~GGOE01006511.1.p1  ORF type:complete len:320 (-),score=106.98 GGOE01006511.1:286-1245(-)